MNIFKILTIFLLFSSWLYSLDQVFLMPDEGKKAEKALLNQLYGAKKSIDIAIYSFTHKKFAKALKKMAKKGIKVNIITNEKDIDRNRQIGYLSKYKNIFVYTLKGNQSRSKKYYGKMHLKVAIIDNKKLLHGSANWSYSAFGLNYETFIITDDKQTLAKFNDYYKTLLKRGKRF